MSPLSYSMYLVSLAFRFYELSFAGGDDGIRTHDPLLAGQVLSQLSYTPIRYFFSNFSGLYSVSDGPSKSNNDEISFSKTFQSRPSFSFGFFPFRISGLICSSFRELPAVLHRKEVIQPHLPIRLPCYDLTPIIEPTFDSCLLAVSSLASGVPDFHGLTGGVYKARERIHRGILIRDY